MASLETRGGSYRVVFYWKDVKRSFSLGEVSAADAAVYKASTEELLRLLKRNLIEMPSGCTVEDFMFHRGKPPEQAAAVATGRRELTLTLLRDDYFRSQEKKLERTTLDGIRLHFDHLLRILGGTANVALISRADLQRYVDKRGGEWIDPEVYRKKRLAKRGGKPKRKYTLNGVAVARDETPERPKRHPSAATIKKEIISLRTAWNWARRSLELVEEFPGAKLDYAKTEEALPFMTWEEAERRIAAGDNPEVVWESLYLRPAEIAELLEWVKGRPVSPWVYPIFCFAAHTGARRSEIVRALPSDIDLAQEVVTIREKKRDKARLTTRRIPMTPFLKAVLTDWSKERGKGRTYFCKERGQEITPREAMNYFNRALRLSNWKVLKGLHVLRHSYISALANRGVDQRIIDELAGHQTEQQRRRYRHLYQQTLTEAAKNLFS